MKDNKIYLKAYFRKNLGDDMFVRCIAERYPNAVFNICTYSKYATPFKKLSNVKNLSALGQIVDRFCGKLLRKKICCQHIEKKADAKVHIGGSIFIEPEKFVIPEKEYSNPKLFVLGCNFGPYQTKAYRDYIYARLQKATDVCFRDQYSYHSFSELEHVRVAPDVLFGYKSYPIPQKGFGIGISVIDLGWRSGLEHIAEQYYRTIAQVVDHCACSAIPVKLFSFCADEGDGKAIAEIMKRCQTKNAEICVYNGDIDFILEKINECEYVIASRFHAMIIGWCLSKKVFPVIYSDKQLHVIGDVGYLGDCWDLRKTKEYAADELIQRTIGSPMLDNIECYRNNAENHFELLDCYLRGIKTD